MSLATSLVSTLDGPGYTGLGAPPATTYNGFVDALGSMVASHWTMPASGATVTDRKAVQNATLSGTIQYLSVPIVQLDTGGRAIGVGASGGMMTVPANAALNATSGAIGLTFQCDLVGSAQQILFARVGNVAGGFAVEYKDLGLGFLQLRAFRYDTANQLRTIVGTVPSVGDAHTCFMTWGPSGLILYVDNVIIGSNGTTAWATDATLTSNPLAFLQWPTGGGLFDGCAGHMILISGTQPTQAQLAPLASPQSIAWAVSIDAGSVSASSSASVDPKVDMAHYKQPIVPQVLTQGSLGTASVSGENLQYAAGSTAGNDDTFTFRFTSANGQLSNSATVTIDVTAVASGFTRVGTWALSETGTSGNNDVFADSIGLSALGAANNATLAVPNLSVGNIPTHTKDRPGIVSGGANAALEVSNGGPAIPIVAGYKQAAMSLVLYMEPYGMWRGSQYWGETEEKFGREYLAFRDSTPDSLTGGTPGHFAIYRRHTGYQSTSWRLGGYVRDAAGTKQYFGSSLAGVSSMSLPPMSRVAPGTTAHRVVLTMGPAGASLWLDNSQSTLPSVTTGWTHPNFTGSIRIGCGDATAHANERSPFWGRMAQVEIWQGQINPTTGGGLRPVAAQSQPYKEPTVGARFNVNAYPNLQACMQAAHDGNGWVYQDYTNTTWYQLVPETALEHLDNCRGAIGLRIRKGPGEFGEADSKHKFMIYTISVLGPRQGGLNDDHGDPYKADGGYRLIGCMFDGNARNQDWTSDGNTSTWGDHDLQHRHCVDVVGDTSVNNTLTVTVDCCDFMDSTADGVSCSANCDVNVKSSRFFGTFRGAVVVNNHTMTKNIRTWACEMEPSATLIGGRADNGSSLNDIEPFGPASGEVGDRINWRMWDCWAHNDLDDKNQGENHAGSSYYFNVHVCGPGFALFGATESDGIADYRLYNCTVGYWRKGLNGFGVPPDQSGSTSASQFPHEAMKGGFPGPLGTGFLFEDCVLLAANRPFYTSRNVSPFTPEYMDPSPACHIRFELQQGQTSGRKATFRRCQWRAFDIGFVSQPNRRCLRVIDTLNSGYSFEFEDCLIDGTFADQPFDMKGATVRHHNNLHERTGSATAMFANAVLVAF